jgi:hypothetical protein
MGEDEARHVHPQSLMGSLSVVALTKGVEKDLTLSQGPRLPAVIHLFLEGAMETLHLPLRLRVSDGSVQEMDILVHDLYIDLGQTVGVGRTPKGTAMISQYLLREAVADQSISERVPSRLSPIGRKCK